MKKLTLLLVSFFAVFALGLTGCSDDPDVKQETPVIKASNPADIAAVAGKVTVPYTVDYAVDGCSLDVTWDATWLHDLSVSADKFTLQADANPGAAREAKLTLTYPEATSVELTVRQMSASESISISPKTLSFSYKGGEETVTVTSSKSWTLEGSADWVEADKTEGESGESVVKFTVSTTNETDAAKEVTFNFVSGSEKAPLKIQQNQEGKLIIDEDSKTISVSNTEQNVTVTCCRRRWCWPARRGLKISHCLRARLRSAARRCPRRFPGCAWCRSPTCTAGALTRAAGICSRSCGCRIQTSLP